MNNMLLAGAMAQRHAHDMSGWRSMDTAPRDGSWVELKCTYGVAPWYCLARWTDEDIARGPNGPAKIKMQKFGWRKPEGGGPFSESHLHWRPYGGVPENYTDPTGGAQMDMAYWRGAVAQQYGLPLDAFEKEAARNQAKYSSSETASDAAAVAGLTGSILIFPLVAIIVVLFLVLFK